MQTAVSSKGSKVPHANKCKSLRSYLDSQSNKLDQGSSINSSIVSRMVMTVFMNGSAVKFRSLRTTFRAEGKRQRLPFFCSFLVILQLNHTNMEECLLLFTANTNIFSLLHRELETKDKSSFFPFAVRRNVILLLSDRVAVTIEKSRGSCFEVFQNKYTLPVNQTCFAIYGPICKPLLHKV